MHGAVYRPLRRTQPSANDPTAADITDGPIVASARVSCECSRRPARYWRLHARPCHQVVAHISAPKIGAWEVRMQVEQRAVI